MNPLPWNRPWILASFLSAFCLSAFPASPTAMAAPSDDMKIKVIAFDAFPIFDPRPVFRSVKTMFPEKGDRLNEVWRMKQFEYTWLREAGGRYKDFWKTTEDALASASKAAGIDLSDRQRREIMAGYLRLEPWPDVEAALGRLKAAGYELVFLSNFTEKMLSSSIRHSGLEERFDGILSTDLSRSFKPSPRAYELALTKLKVRKDEVLFVPFAAWDMAGAEWFGYRTFWVNRMGSAAEGLDAAPDGAGPTLTDLVRFLGLGE